MDFLGIPKAVPPIKLESFAIYTLEELGIKLHKSQIVVCYRLGKSLRIIVEFLNRKNAKIMLEKKEKF